MYPAVGKKTAPLIEFYKKKKLLKRIDGNPTLMVAVKDVIKSLKK